MTAPDDTPFPDPMPRADLAVAIDAMPASRLVGLRCTGLDGAGRARIELGIVPAHTVDGRTVQGGLVGLLADYAGVAAAACAQEAGWSMVTTGYQVHNLAPADGVRLVAIGRLQHRARTTAVSAAEVWSVAADGTRTLVAVATTTSRAVPMPSSR